MDVENGEGPVSGKEEHPGESSVARGEAAEEILSFYERLDVNPRVLFLDAVTSKFILPALFAVMPFDMQDDRISEKALRYATLRKKLLKRLNIRLIPAAFSLRIDDTRLEEAADRPQMSILRRLLSQDVKGKALSNCVIHPDFYRPGWKRTEALAVKRQLYSCLSPGKQKGRKYFIIPCFSATLTETHLLLSQPSLLPGGKV